MTSRIREPLTPATRHTSPDTFFVMQAIILAAGLGNRLGNLTEDRPKALVPVCGKELILHVMDYLNHPEITDRTVVTGFEADKFQSFLKD